uniref:Putative N-acetylneuraminate synthase n=2 Tax=viral metagenome TaxID=1070528 RepID=A0A6M3LBK1_9ZZZZ
MGNIQIIAEIGINHNGSIETAKALMDVAKQCGCDYIKFQKRDIDTVYSKEFLDSPRESPWGKTQGEQKRALEFGFEEYREIDRYSEEIGLPWFASCWDFESLAFIESFNPPLHKIASPMLTHKIFVRKVASLGRTTLISTGMSDWVPILNAASIFEAEHCPYALFHCTSEYPCPDDACNISMIPELRKKFPGVSVGYSNHSPGILSCIGAAFLGAEWIEAHVTLDRTMYGSDQAASIERPGLERIVQYCKLAPKVIGDGIKIIRAAEKTNAKKLRYWEA